MRQVIGKNVFGVYLTDVELIMYITYVRYMRKKNEPQREKTHLLISAPNEDSNQPAQPRGPISFRCPHEDILHPWLSKMCPVNLRWERTCPKVRFLTLRLKF